MSQTHGTLVVVLLAVLCGILIHQGYLRKHPQARWEYRASESATIDLAQLQTEGADGWDCSLIAAAADRHVYIKLCKRFVH